MTETAGETATPLINHEKELQMSTETPDDETEPVPTVDTTDTN